jgi:rhodanese-related sulfurtransferase
MLEFRFSGMPALQSRDIKIVLYCKTSGRAALAGVALQDMGYLNIQNIAGGFDAWVAAGKPVAKPDTPSFD